MANISINSQKLKHNVYLKPVLQNRFNRHNSHQKRGPNLSSRSEKPSSTHSFDITSANPFSFFPSDLAQLSKFFYKKSKKTINKSPGKCSQSIVVEDTLPKLSRVTPVKKKPSFDIVEYEEVPETLAKWEHSERIYWNKRKILGLRVVVLMFEGVLGDFYKKNLWDFKAHDFFLRPGWIQGLAKLLKGAFVAIFSTSTRDNLKFIAEYFTSNKVSIDAIYKKRGGLERQSSDISQVLSDFRVSSCILVSSIALEAGELEERSGWNLLYEPTASEKKRIVAFSCPVNSTINIFFPNPRAQINDSAILFTEICDFLMRVLKSHDSGNFLDILAEEGELKKVLVPMEKLGGKGGACSIFVNIGKLMKKRPYTSYILAHLKTEMDLQKFLKKSGL